MMICRKYSNSKREITAEMRETPSEIGKLDKPAYPRDTLFYYTPSAKEA